MGGFSLLKQLPSIEPASAEIASKSAKTDSQSGTVNIHTELKHEKCYGPRTHVHTYTYSGIALKVRN